MEYHISLLWQADFVMYYTVVVYLPHSTATQVSTDFLDNIFLKN